MTGPDFSRIPEWYHGYARRVKEPDINKGLAEQARSFLEFLHDIPVSRQDYRYAPDKWSIRQLILHITDAERIFAYRALRFSRRDTTALPGFDENSYALHDGHARRSWSSLLSEFSAVRQATLTLFESFTPEDLEQEGIASGHSVYVGGIGYIIIGHVLHHKAIIRERYLAD